MQKVKVRIWTNDAPSDDPFRTGRKSIEFPSTARPFSRDSGRVIEKQQRKGLHLPSRLSRIQPTKIKTQRALPYFVPSHPLSKVHYTAGY